MQQPLAATFHRLEKLLFGSAIRRVSGAVITLQRDSFEMMPWNLQRVSIC